MWHFFRSLWGNAENYVLSFRTQFLAGGLAGTGILLHIAPPHALTIYTALGILIKAAMMGGATAMGGWVMKSIIKGYLKRRRKKLALRKKKEIEDGKRKECA